MSLSDGGEKENEMSGYDKQIGDKQRMCVCVCITKDVVRI